MYKINIIKNEIKTKLRKNLIVFIRITKVKYYSVALSGLIISFTALQGFHPCL